MPRNDFEFDDLHGVDLSQLDLEHIDVGDLEHQRSPVWRWLALLLLFGLGGLVLWFPTTPYYHNYGHSSWVFFLICGVSVVVGISVGRWLWEWAQEVAARLARQPPREVRPEEPEKPASAATRFFVFLLIAGGIIAILVGLPASGALESSGAVSGIWFLAAIGAVVIGVLAGRWLLMQAQAHAAKQSEPAAPIRLPPWFKWVTLVILICGGAAALVAPTFYTGSNAETVRFSLGGVGFVVGIVGAVWLARRFEEAEEKIKLRQRRGSPPVER